MVQLNRSLYERKCYHFVYKIIAKKYMVYNNCNLDQFGTRANLNAGQIAEKKTISGFYCIKYYFRIILFIENRFN